MKDLVRDFILRKNLEENVRAEVKTGRKDPAKAKTLLKKVLEYYVKRAAIEKEYAYIYVKRTIRKRVKLSYTLPDEFFEHLGVDRESEEARNRISLLMNEVRKELRRRADLRPYFNKIESIHMDKSRSVIKIVPKKPSRFSRD